MPKHKKAIKLFILLSLFCSVLVAQEMDKVVFVESTFKPNVEDAEKLNVIPGLTDTLKAQPEINYSVLPSRIDARYKIKPIKPAKLVGSPLDKLYNSRIRLGIGNYTTPLAEFSIHNLRSKEYAVGAYAYHKSSHNKLKLGNGHKVPAGYGINRFSVYGKRFYKELNVEGDVGFNTHKLRLYGYNTSNFSDDLPSMDAEDIRQWYSQFTARAEVYSTDIDSTALRYRVAFLADYFGDDYANSQNHVEIPASLSFMVEEFRIHLHANYHYLHSVLDTHRGKNDYVFQIRPILQKKGDQWEVHAGANIYFNSYGSTNFYPEAQLSFQIVEKVMEAFFGIEGNLEVNHFSKIARENLYITPGLNTKNTNHKIIGYGGVKGAFSSDAGYKAEIRFSSVEDMYFFVNDTNSVLENTFVPVFDDVELVTFGGELWYAPTTFLDFYLQAKFHAFNMGVEKHPWHKPASELTFTTAYNYKEKIYVNLDVLHMGKRYAKNFSNANRPIELKSVWDINLRLEYKYSNVLSAFLNVHNILAQQYQLWNQYPTQKLNLLAGFSYKF